MHNDIFAHVIIASFDGKCVSSSGGVGSKLQHFVMRNGSSIVRLIVYSLVGYNRACRLH